MALITKFQLGNYTVNTDNSDVIPTDVFTVINYKMVTQCSNDGFHPTTTPKTEFIEIEIECASTQTVLFGWYTSNSKLNGCINIKC